MYNHIARMKHIKDLLLLTSNQRLWKLSAMRCGGGGGGGEGGVTNYEVMFEHFKDYSFRLCGGSALLVPSFLIPMQIKKTSSWYIFIYVQHPIIYN